MIIVGTPKASELDQYYVADGFIAFMLHQAGFIPKYKDEDCLYFKINKKLLKWVNEHID